MPRKQKDLMDYILSAAEYIDQQSRCADLTGDTEKRIGLQLELLNAVATVERNIIPQQPDYTIAQLARELNYSADRVSTMVQNGVFSGAYRMGDGNKARWRIPHLSVAQFKAATAPRKPQNAQVKRAKLTEAIYDPNDPDKYKQALLERCAQYSKVAGSNL